MLQNRLAALCLLVAALAFGCADGTLPAATSPRDPSNPAAPEAPFSRTSPVPGSAPAAASAAPTAPVGEVEYVCPMHAQIVRAAPGSCPICGMTLAPRAKAESAHDHGGAK